MRCLVSVFGLLVVAGVARAQDFEFVSVRPVGADGTSAPTLGDETYGLKASFKVFHAAGSFRVRFRIANKETDANVPGAGRWEYDCRFAMPLDGPIPYAVTLDPDQPGLRGNEFKGTFTPRAPSKAVEYFAPRDLVATETLVTRFAPVGDLADLTTVFGTPTTATSQAVLSLTPPDASRPIQTAPFGEPALLSKLAQVPETLTQTLAFTVRASNVRINADLIRDDWRSIALLPREIARYTAPEATVQSTDPRIAAYVKTNLPFDYRATLTPVQTARRLYCAVMRDTTYQCPSPPDALSVLTSGRGDCGGFSRLYAACLRSIGIPARTVCGWLKGDDQWHGWSEIYLPSAGWIPQDATFGKTYSPDGSYAYYFGIMPDLNGRVVVSRAATNGIEGAPYSGELQQPAQWHWCAGKVTTQLTKESHATLKEAMSAGGTVAKGG